MKKRAKSQGKSADQPGNDVPKSTSMPPPSKLAARDKFIRFIGLEIIRLKDEELLRGQLLYDKRLSVDLCGFPDFALQYASVLEMRHPGETPVDVEYYCTSIPGIDGYIVLRYRAIVNGDSNDCVDIYPATPLNYLSLRDKVLNKTLPPQRSEVSPDRYALLRELGDLPPEEIKEFKYKKSKRYGSLRYAPESDEWYVIAVIHLTGEKHSKVDMRLLKQTRKIELRRIHFLSKLKAAEIFATEHENNQDTKWPDDLAQFKSLVTFPFNESSWRPVKQLRRKKDEISTTILELLESLHYLKTAINTNSVKATSYAVNAPHLCNRLLIAINSFNDASKSCDLPHFVDTLNEVSETLTTDLSNFKTIADHPSLRRAAELVDYLHRLHDKITVAYDSTAKVEDDADVLVLDGPVRKCEWLNSGKIALSNVPLKDWQLMPPPGDAATGESSD